MDADADRPLLYGQNTRLYNRPGLSALDYRIGTHSTFSRRMLARLRGQSMTAASGLRTQPLAALTTRDSNDPAVAFIDAWAVAADVISFYQERIANEGFLRTATERRSVLELARAVGYELSPGVSASAFVTFFVEDAAGAPPVVTIPKGTNIQSIPGQEQLPQTFETMEAIEARAEWNELRLNVPLSPQPAPPISTRQTITADATELWLQGTDTRLKPGDALLIGFPQVQANDQWRLVTLQTINADSAQDFTRVTWGGGALKNQPLVMISGIQPLPSTPCVFALRQQAGMFGNVAPDWTKLSEQQQKAFSGTSFANWPNFEVVGKTLDLDATYPGILDGSLAAVVSQGVTRLFTITRASTLGRVDFMLTGKVTRLDLDAGIDAQASVDRRSASVLVQSERLRMLPSITVAAAGRPPPQTSTRTGALTTALTIDREVSGLRPGQPIVITGTTDTDTAVSELVTLVGTSDSDGLTTLNFQPALQHRYFSTTVSIAANVVRATHGETVSDEVLGSGDGRQANQCFTLRKKPLTYVSAPTASGIESTLEVRVNDVLWQAAPSLFGLTPRSQAYTLRRDNDGKSSVIFGDGDTGARLPSGQENVTATYRFGMGMDGNVDAGALALLQTRPLGIRSVTNALAAQGGAPPESLESARGRAPRTVITLGRIVSQGDFEELAQSFTGIGKAQAALLWTGEARVLHLTVADALGGGIDRDSDLYRAIVGSLRTLGNGLQNFQIDAFTPRFFDLAARLWIDRRFRHEEVVGAVQAALQSAFSFERRAFGQGVAASEVIAIIQDIAGVVAVDLDQFHDIRDEDGPAPRSLITASVAHMDFTLAQPHVAPAELLLIKSGYLRLSAAVALESVS